MCTHLCSRAYRTPVGSSILLRQTGRNKKKSHSDLHEYSGSGATRLDGATFAPSYGQTGPVSPVSRGRKPKKKQQRRKVTRQDPLPFDEFDPDVLLDELIAPGTPAVTGNDALDAERAGAAFIAFAQGGADGDPELLLDALIPGMEQRATPEALATLLAIGTVADGLVGAAARNAADRLTLADVPVPPWVRESAQPLTSADHQRLHDSGKTVSLLSCTFHRSGRSHAFLISVDELNCGEAGEIALLDAVELPGVLDDLRAEIERTENIELVAESLDPAEFRWQLESALEIRGVHDIEAAESGTPPTDDEQNYHAIAELLWNRLGSLPQSGKPLRPHLEGTAPAAFPPPVTDLRPAGPTTKLPPKRKKSQGVAPTYRVRVTLTDAIPPIWRMLEVPGDITLARLHDVIQTAFGWTDMHMHMFRTDFGDFGTPDPEFGCRSEKPVTLEQVVAAPGAKLSYIYDFGDDWAHDLVVEAVAARLDADTDAGRPRCIDGGRAAPPEDCGGIFGYEDLLETLADHNNPDHANVLEWLGINSADAFAPEEFDVDAVDSSLRRLR